VVKNRAILALMPECSICSRGAETARVVNELLERQTPLREIQSQTSIHKNTLHRHQHGNCIFSFSKYKAAKVKARASNVSLGGRLVVQWPGPNGTDGPFSFTLHGAPIPSSSLRTSDVLFVVSYQQTDPARVGNPRALPLTPENIERFLDMALTEDAERKAYTSPN
jgi:hypothetical protein